MPKSHKLTYYRNNPQDGIQSLEVRSVDLSFLSRGISVMRPTPEGKSLPLPCGDSCGGGPLRPVSRTGGALGGHA